MLRFFLANSAEITINFLDYIFIGVKLLMINRCKAMKLRDNETRLNNI